MVINTDFDLAAVQIQLHLRVLMNIIEAPRKDDVWLLLKNFPLGCRNRAIEELAIRESFFWAVFHENEFIMRLAIVSGCISKDMILSNETAADVAKRLSLEHLLR